MWRRSPGDITRAGLSPQTLSEFEHNLHGALGEVGRAVEKAVLEQADIERPSVDHGGMRHYWKYKGPLSRRFTPDMRRLAEKYPVQLGGTVE